MRWIGNFDDPSVEWAMGTGETDGEIVFSASTIAILNSLIPGASDTEIRSRVTEVMQASGLLVGVFQRAIHTFLTAPQYQTAPLKSEISTDPEKPKGKESFES